MNAGVSTTPCGVANAPARAAPVVVSSVKSNAHVGMLTRQTIAIASPYE